LAHNSVPLTLTEEEVGQVLGGGYVVKVIYLPAGQGAELGPAQLTGTGAGTDPAAEAARRGSVLLVFRLGNRDEELPPKAPGGR
jgi:hypothetical protein